LPSLSVWPLISTLHVVELLEHLDGGVEGLLGVGLDRVLVDVEVDALDDAG
jgi:hypothetical protein